MEAVAFLLVKVWALSWHQDFDITYSHSVSTDHQKEYLRKSQGNSIISTQCADSVFYVCTVLYSFAEKQSDW